ncbi:MAG TPA: hypothetical protein VK509_20005, partial [Polyangiales bacterium]|nr:hypothetical protein [Polyangiales bacterium]
MNTLDCAKAVGLAAGLLCSACQFETGALSLQGDLAPADASEGAAEPSAPFDNPANGSSSASPGSQNAGAPSAIGAD